MRFSKDKCKEELNKELTHTHLLTHWLRTKKADKGCAYDGKYKNYINGSF